MPVHACHACWPGGSPTPSWRLWGHPVGDLAPLQVTSPSWAAGLSSLQGLENTVLLVGWDWWSFEPVVCVQTPGKSFWHRPGLGFPEHFTGHLCQWKQSENTGPCLVGLCSFKSFKPHSSAPLPLFTGLGCSDIQQEQYSWYTGGWRNGFREPSFLEGWGKRKGEKILLKLCRREIVLVRTRIKLRCCSGCYFWVTIWVEILIFNSKEDVHVITTSKKIELGKNNPRCWEIIFYMYFSWMNTMYSSNVFIQCSHLDRNEHILLIQTNWVGGLNEMSELLFFFFWVTIFKKKCSSTIFKGFEQWS